MKKNTNFIFEKFFQSQCQEKSGKAINKSNTIVVKSYGTMNWMDKETGEGKQRFGSMNIHFKEECLKGYSKLFYAPDQINFSKVKIDEKNKPMLKREGIHCLSGLAIYRTKQFTISFVLFYFYFFQFLQLRTSPI